MRAAPGYGSRTRREEFVTRSTSDEYGKPTARSGTTTLVSTATDLGGNTSTNGTGGEGYGWLGAKTWDTLDTGPVRRSSVLDSLCTPRACAFPAARDRVRIHIGAEFDGIV